MRRRSVTRVAIVTDSAADLPPVVAASAGVAVVPLTVTFGPESFRAGVNLTTEEFWQRMTAADAPFPTTAASSPGDFHAAFEAAFAGGADAVVCVDVAETLSGTIRSARVARGMLGDREIHVVDSGTASMGVGLLALLGARMAAAGLDGTEIAATLERRASDVDLYVALDTLEYLRRGGRISGAQATIGNLLSVKPIITVTEGHVTTADRVRTRSKARERVLELLTHRPIEQAALLYAPPADIDAFQAAFVERSGFEPASLLRMPIGPSVGPHVGPGCYGGVVLYREREAAVEPR